MFEQRHFGEDFFYFLASNTFGLHLCLYMKCSLLAQTENSYYCILSLHLLSHLWHQFIIQTISTAKHFHDMLFMCSFPLSCSIDSFFLSWKHSSTGHSSESQCCSTEAVFYWWSGSMSYCFSLDRPLLNSLLKYYTKLIEYSKDCALISEITLEANYSLIP